MKVTIDIDCTPQEARAFLGLPDVKPMQDVVMAKLQDQVTQNLSQMDPETILKTWVPMGIQNMEQLQKFFWAQMTGAGPGGRDGA